MPTAGSTAIARTQTGTCASCGERVILAKRGGRLAEFEDVQVRGGAFRIDRATGRAERRSLVELYLAQRSGMDAFGYALHECPTERWDQR